MMTSGGFSSSRMFSRVSRPSTPGNHTSSRTTSKADFRNSSRQASPLPAEEAVYPSSAKMPLRDSRIPASSSTTRMLCMLGSGGGRCGFRHDRQFDDEAGADRMIFFDADRAVMIFHNAAYDGEAEASAAFFGGEIGQKKFLFQFAGHAVAGVGDGNLDGVAAGDERSGNLDLADHRVLQRFGGVVDQVGDGALDGLAVG